MNMRETQICADELYSDQIFKLLEQNKKDLQQTVEDHGYDLIIY
jgi:hypothetical protein